LLNEIWEMSKTDFTKLNQIYHNLNGLELDKTSLNNLNGFVTEYTIL
jgi:hypothetical protein